MINLSMESGYAFCKEFKEISLEMIKQYIFNAQPVPFDEDEAQNYLYNLCVFNTFCNSDLKLKEKINLPKHHLVQYIRNNIFSIFSALEQSTRNELTLFDSPEHRNIMMKTVRQQIQKSIKDNMPQDKFKILPQGGISMFCTEEDESIYNDDINSQLLSITNTDHNASGQEQIFQVQQQQQQIQQQEQEENNFANENNENNNASLTIVDGNEVYTNITCDL